MGEERTREVTGRQSKRKKGVDTTDGGRRAKNFFIVLTSFLEKRNVSIFESKKDKR